MAKNLAGRKVQRMQCHVGYGNLARTGCHAERDQAEMELTPVGVHVNSKEGEFLVPYSNVTWCHLSPEEAQSEKTKAVMRRFSGDPSANEALKNL